MNKQTLEKEGRITGKSFQQVFYVEYWVEHDLDDTLIEWQVQEENMKKSIPLLLFFLLRDEKRNLMKQLYLERYHKQNILPEWDCIPMFKELELFIKNESNFFDERLDEPLSSLFDEQWRKTITHDDCYCDFEMCPVTQLLTMND